jgi:hypothetical protein
MKNNIASLLSAAAAVALTTLGAAPLLAQQATPGTTGSISATRNATEKPSGTLGASITSTATVAKIDKKDRWITLKLADGSMVDIQAGPAVKNFAQIKVGDLVTASQEETLAIAVVPAGSAPPNATGGSAAVSAPLGAKPMGVLVDTAMVSGTVTAIDNTPRSITLRGPDGITHTIAVGPAVQRLNEVKVGDDVVFTLKKATTIEVTSPAK